MQFIFSSLYHLRNDRITNKIVSHLGDGRIENEKYTSFMRLWSRDKIYMREEKRLKYGELANLILEAIANGLIEGWRGYPRGFRLPMVLGYLIKYILEVKKAKIKKERIEKAIKNLQQREILSFERKNDKIYIYLQEKGERRVIKHSIKLLLDFKKKKRRWDGRWFLVFFDVPEIERRKRNYLRQFLKELGFYQYQQSVYIFPYECEKEVILIKKVVESAEYMKYIIADKIEDEGKIKRFFNLV